MKGRSLLQTELLLAHVFIASALLQTQANDTSLLDVASKSAMSGKPYKIHCPNEQTINSQHWLLNALSTFGTLNMTEIVE